MERNTQESSSGREDEPANAIIDILVAEDSMTQALTLQHVLQSNGYQVRTARNGREALSEIRENMPDLVISDILMPEMDGYELSKEIKRDSRFKDIAVILLTSHYNPEDILRGLESRADTFLMKPFSEEELLARISQVLNASGTPGGQRCVGEGEFFWKGRKYSLNVDRRQTINFLLSAYELAFQKNRESERAREHLLVVQKELIEAKEKAEAYNEAKSSFLASMNHELRTPLNTVIGFSEVLLEQYFGSLNDKQAEYVKNVRDAGKHLLFLINDILDLSRINADQTEIRLSRVNVRELLDQSLEMIREKSLARGISLEAQIDGEVEATAILADSVMLKQVVYVLLSNAVKFTPPGGHISLEARIAENAHLVVAVSDTGIGIEMRDQKRIFEAFVQLEDVLTRSREGPGIGLAIARRFVDLHQGRIWVESKGEGLGSRFIFSIPVISEKERERYEEPKE
jgi:two-component system, sensor histidine kinase and response regulator